MPEKINKNPVAAGIDAKENQQDALSQSESRFYHIIDASPVPYALNDEEQNITYLNPAFVRTFGYDLKDIPVLEQWWPKAYPDKEYRQWVANTWQQRLDAAKKSGQPFEPIELKIRCKNGLDRTILANAASLSETFQGIHLVILYDITERKKTEEKIEFLAYHDPLTKLPNRALAKDRMERSIAHAKRTKRKAALLFLDIDNFKTINNTLGHLIGDALLVSVAENLNNCVREVDTISRQGGDEFLIMLEDVSNIEGIENICENILERLGRPFSIEEHHLAISLSIGVAVYPNDGKNFDTLLKKSDAAMYQAKQAGKNTFQFYTEQMNTDVTDYLKIRVALKHAIENNEFSLHYQPQINLSSGKIIGAEALIRWNHPEMGFIPPDRFIPIAEDIGLIVPIGEWVLEEACRQASLWHQSGHEIIIAVNLSSVQFRRGNLEQTVIQALTQTGLAPAYLELELTESILIQNTENVLNTVNRLKSFGVKLSIDDFGTGYSSLAYLKRFAVDKLKIDRSFIHNMVKDSSDAAIVHAIIQMAKSLNLKTIAEGVEDKITLDALKLHHCDEIQGYYYSAPIPANDFIDYLIKN